MKRYMLFCILAACGASTPTPADQAKLGAYEAALQACIVQAKASDGGLPSYEGCAANVDKSFGVGGAK